MRATMPRGPGGHRGVTGLAVLLSLSHSTAGLGSNAHLRPVHQLPALVLIDPVQLQEGVRLAEDVLREQQGVQPRSAVPALPSPLTLDPSPLGPLSSRLSDEAAALPESHPL